MVMACQYSCLLIQVLAKAVLLNVPTQEVNVSFQLTLRLQGFNPETDRVIQTLVFSNAG